MIGRSVGGRSVTLAAVVCLLITATGSSAAALARQAPTQGLGPRIVLSATDVSIDEPVDIAVRGMAPGQTVRLDLTLERQRTYKARAWFRADGLGRVQVARTAPLRGSYQGVDAMGLFWSAVPVSTSPPNRNRWIERVHLDAFVAGHEVAQADLVRHHLDARVRVTPVRQFALVGTMFQAPGHQPRATLVVLGGSEGGVEGAEDRAAAFASHGYNALAVAYFDPVRSLGTGLPPALTLIPLEYFARAINWLRHQPSVDANRLGIVGGSKGAELALLLASRHPELKAVVAYAPSSAAWTSTNVADFGRSSWSERGQPVPFLIPRINVGPTANDWYLAALADPNAARGAIPIERANGAVILISGKDDQLWPSSYMACQLMGRLRAHPLPHRHLDYDGAGHVIVTPYQPTTDRAVIPGTGIPLGGNPVDAARADRDHWPKVLRFLHDNLA